MRHGRWAGAALVMLGCGGQVDGATGVTSAGGQGGASGGMAGGGMAGGGGALSGGSGEGGGALAGGGQAGSGLSGSSGQGGVAGGGEAGGAGQGGQGGEMLAGCDWHAQLLAKAKATSGPLHGLLRLRSDGSAEHLPITLANPPAAPYPTADGASPPGETWTSVWKVVAATDAHVFLTARTPDHYQLLVAVSTTSGVPAVAIEAEVLTMATATRADAVGEVPGWLYYLQTRPVEGVAWRLRRVSLADPTTAPETVSEGAESYFRPDEVLLAGDEMFLSGYTLVRRVRKDKTFQDYLTGGHTLADGATGFAVLGDRLVYNYESGGGGVLSDLRTVAINDNGFEPLGSQKVSKSSILTTVLDGEGKVVTGMLAYGGLVTLSMPTPVPPVPIKVVWKAPAADAPYLRLNHLEYGTVGSDAGYFVDVPCGPPNTFAPAFVTTAGELRLRAAEPGFPFVQPLPWANTPDYEDWRQHGTTQGIYAVLD